MTSKNTTADLCPLHGEKQWIDCWQCAGEGVYGHDCGDDTCVCLHPEEKPCDICRGKGGHMVCTLCRPEALQDIA